MAPHCLVYDWANTRPLFHTHLWLTILHPKSTVQRLMCKVMWSTLWRYWTNDQLFQFLGLCLFCTIFIIRCNAWNKCNFTWKHTSWETMFEIRRKQMHKTFLSRTVNKTFLSKTLADHISWGFESLLQCDSHNQHHCIIFSRYYLVHWIWSWRYKISYK